MNKKDNYNVLVNLLVTGRLLVLFLFIFILLFILISSMWVEYWNRVEYNAVESNLISISNCVFLKKEISENYISRSEK
jgi:cell division protein FtsL